MLEPSPLRQKSSGGALGTGEQKKKKAKDKAQILGQIVSSKKQEEEEKHGLDTGTGGPREDAGEAANGAGPEENAENHKQRVKELNRHLDTLMSTTTFPGSAGLNDRAAVRALQLELCFVCIKQGLYQAV